MKTLHSNAHLSIYRMEYAPTFMLKEDVSVVTHVSLYLRNRRGAIGMCVSLYHTSGRVSDINLSETCRKADRLLFTLHRARSVPR
jgi:hypothetical protein